MNIPPRPGPFATSPNVARANRWLKRAWATGLARRPSLHSEALWRRATGHLPRDAQGWGRSADDVMDFAERLERLLTALRDEAELTALGRTMAHGQLVGILRNRLRLGAIWRERPDLLDTRLAPPLLVLGQMRSGTTRLHRLLAADPHFAATRFCDSWTPVPQRPDWRPLKSRAAIAIGRRLNPWLDAIHPIGVTEADEELGWLSAGLHHAGFECQWRIPSYVAWSEARDPLPVYREFQRIWQTDAAHHGNAGRTRVMKVPQFGEDLPTLVDLWPGAKIVTIVRDAARVVASSASLAANQMAIQSDAQGAFALGREWRRKVALRETRTELGLAAHEGASCEISYAEMRADWHAAIARIYRELDLALSAQATAAMAARVATEERSPHHGHRYDPAWFGLDEGQQIERRLTGLPAAHPVRNDEASVRSEPPKP